MAVYFINGGIMNNWKPKVRKKIYDVTKGKCYYCGCEIQDKKTIDHKTPVIKGGTNENDNLVLSCLHCNTQKGNKTEEEYRKWLIDKDNL